METLQQFIQSNLIPESIHFQDTFFSATMMQRREDLWTNIYAFFLNKELQHGFEDLFIKSFIEVINLKKSNVSPINLQESYNLEREIFTAKGNRIDLIIKDRNTAIIIENKVGHILDNDLQDYYDSVKGYKKIGVVLSIQKYSSLELNNRHFISITHEELIQNIYRNYLKLDKTTDKYSIFFEEFYKNVINESKTINMDQIDFYLRNTEKVNKIIDVKKQYDLHIIKQINDLKVFYEEEFICFGKDGNHFSLKSRDNSNLMITVVYNFLLNGERKVSIVVELQNELLDEFRGLESLDAFTFDEIEKECLIKEYTKQRDKWGHFALQVFDNLSSDDIVNLAKFVSNQLDKSAILNIYKKIKGNLFLSQKENQ